MRPTDFKSHAICLVLTLGLVTACGYAEWPPRDEQPRDINASAAPAPASASARSFVGATAVIVGRGDTVYALSKRHQVPMQALIRANGLTAPFVLQVGQRLQLPRVRTHKVVRGDTLFGIANTYDVNAFELARINDLKKPYVIHVGESLIMPSDSDAAKTQITRSAAADPPPPQTIARSSARPDTAADKAKTPAAPAWVAPPKLTTAQAVRTAVPQVRQALAKPPPKSRQGFLWPVRGKIISTYGVKSKGLRNDGINIQARRGNPVYAAEHGVVAYAGNELRGFGNLLLIKHADGWVTAYAHNEALLVKRGDTIQRGQKIATIGSTGSVTSPQLHFEIRRGNKARDPKTLLRGEA